MKKLRGTKRQDAVTDGGHRYCCVAAAIIGAAVVGGVVADQGSKRAAGAQEDAANQANATSQSQFDQTRKDQLAQYEQQRTDNLALLERQRKDQAPWLEAGKGALGQLTTGIGPGGQFSDTFKRTAFAEDPGYQFRIQQGEQGIQRAAGARGGLYSGATLKALARFNGDSASSEYANYDTRENNKENQFNNTQAGKFNRLAALAGIGQTATNQVQAAGTAANSNIGQAGQNAFGTIANAGNINSGNIQSNMIGAGNARASGYVGGANALTGAIGQGITGYQNNNLIQSMMNRGGGNGYAAGNAAFLNNNAGLMQSQGLTQADLYSAG